MSLVTGSKLGPYEIIAPLGAGGMGEVYRARDTRLDRDVAVKVLPASTANIPDALARFEREAKAVAALSHPNIVALHDVGRHENTSYVVMELLEGETLRSRISRSVLSPRKAIEVGTAIADGLAAAHSKGVIHRDLKPENIFITTEGLVKILDFGLARSTGPVGPTHDLANSPTLTLQTTPGAIIGTLCYMAPEQIRGAATDARTDIFAFGCVMYEMLTGRRAFLGETAADTMTAILKEDPTSVRTARSGVGLELERLIDRCLEKRPEQRFQSASDLAFTLRATANTSQSGVTTLPPSASRWLMRLSVAGVLAAVIAIAAWFLRSGTAGSGADERAKIQSLAVLPFENVARDPEEDYFVDGMTEALISDLARIRSLRIISRTSVMRFKGTTKSIPEIARELKVDAVVEGSVLRIGERVRITTQVIHAATDDHLWSDSYERDLRDVLSLQTEVARSIAGQIKATLTPQEGEQVSKNQIIDPDAYQAYLKGRFHWNKRTAEGLAKSVEYFEQAVTLAPDWALGYVGLADAYALMPNYSSVRPSEAIPQAKAAAAKALLLDDRLGEAHASIANNACEHDWDWTTAEREFQLAISLSPNYATAHHWYSRHLTFMGRHAAAFQEITKAQELDPLSTVISVSVGRALYYSGDFVQAENQYRRTIEFDPDSAAAHVQLAKTLLMHGSIAESITEAREASRLSNNTSYHAAILGYLCAKNGQSDEAQRILDDLLARTTKAYVAPTNFALLHAGLGESGRMFDWLEKAFQERDASLLDMLTDPLMADMRTDPRFGDLVRRVGLPPLPVPRGDKQK